MLSDVSILIVIKNIISTAKTETKITVISLDVSSIKEDILSSPIGSTNKKQNENNLKNDLIKILEVSIDKIEID